jgi:hypothetical protein
MEACNIAIKEIKDKREYLALWKRRRDETGFLAFAVSGFSDDGTDFLQEGSS